MTSTTTTSQITSLPRQPRPTPPNTLNLTTLNEPLDDKKNRHDIIISNDKFNQKLISPNLVQKVRQRSPIIHNVEDNILIPPTSQGIIEINCLERGQQLLIKTAPPPPPPRWAKPAPTSTSSITLSSKTVIILNTNQPENQEQLLKNNITTTSNKILSPLSPTLKLSNEIKTPITTPSSGSNKSHRRRHHHHNNNREIKKNSQHYQESDILESYCRSSPGDKISDYEDIWNTNDKSNNTSNYSPNDKSFTSPDCLKDTFGERLMVLRNNRSSKSREKLSYMEIQSPEFSSFKPIIETNCKNLKVLNSPDDYIVTQLKRPDLLSRVCSSNSLNTTPLSTKMKMSMMFTKSESNSPMTPESKINSPFYAEPADAIQQGNNKIQQFVPRRKNRCNGLISKYRHSEPGWFQGQITGEQVNPIDWNQVEKCEDKIPLISSSVDNLVKRYGTKEKKVVTRAKPVQPPKLRAKVTNDTSWTVDSSWEFIGNEGDEEGYSEGEEERCFAEDDGDKKDKNCDKNSGDNEREDGGSGEDKCTRKFPKDDGQKIVGNALTVQSIIFER